MFPKAFYFCGILLAGTTLALTPGSGSAAGPYGAYRPATAPGNGGYPYYGYYPYYPYFGYNPASSPAIWGGRSYVPATSGGPGPAYGDLNWMMLALEADREQAALDKARARITVKVPAGAEVWFGEHKTSASGPVRTFQSPPLKESRQYTYAIRARWEQDGREVTQTRDVDVSRGTKAEVDFTLPSKGKEKAGAGER